MSNPYLDALRTKYEAMQSSIQGVQTRAVDENRSLTKDELDSIKTQSDTAKAVFEEIESLTAIETRNVKVQALAVQLESMAAEPAAKQGEPVGTQTRATKLGTTTTKERDPGHYRSASEGGSHSFFGDMYRSRFFQDEKATGRLAEHRAALDTVGEGVGTVAPKWMTEEFENLARQGRALANAVRSVPLGDDPRPMTLPKQITGNDTNVVDQAAENDPIVEGFWDSDVDVVTPKAIAGKDIVSRQMVDMSSPAIDQLIFGDLMSVYNLQVEKKVGAAVIAAGGTAVKTIATDTAFGTAAAGIDAIIDASIAVRNDRKLGANVVAMSVNRWGKYKKLKDGSNRPLIPVSTYGPQNVSGLGSVNVDGVIEDLAVVATEGIGDGTTFPEKVFVMRSSDILLFESNLLRFRYEEQLGPESVVLGIWGYVAVLVRQRVGAASKSVKHFVITAGT